MRDFLESWGGLLTLITVVALAFALPAIVGGCEHVKRVAESIDVAVCYVHPEFGKVCVEYDGKVHLRFDIASDPVKLGKVTEWLKDKLPAGVSIEPVSTPSPAASTGADPPR